MGLLDAACLVDTFMHAVLHRRDLGNRIDLHRYERWRKADNGGLSWGIDGMQRVFAAQRNPIPRLRAIGMQATHGVPGLKKMIMQYAIGARCHLPTLAK